MVPALTEFVLDRYGQDRQVFRDFCDGADNHDLWSDGTLEYYDRKAEGLRLFRTHRCARIRDWASRSEQSVKHFAEWFRVDDEEMRTP